MREAMKEMAQQLSDLRNIAYIKGSDQSSDDCEYCMAAAAVTMVIEHELDEMYLEDKVDHSRLRILVEALGAITEPISDPEIKELTEKITSSRYKIATRYQPLPAHQEPS